ncbi:hypothetical protein DRJ17_05280 [Candidatus Woesearchaeota archaeon]|nr:MAG: hypothetical protein DRJ17_05280 [Candidatus Woesearchaeota archaeon]
MANLDKYVKIVILSTLEKPKTLVEISTTWFKNKGRLYQPQIIKEIKKAVESGLLIQDKKFYEPNIPKLFDLLLADLSLGEQKKIVEEYKNRLKQFYVNLGDYTRKTYLNFEIIKVFTNLDQRKAAELDLKLLIQLPLLLRFLEYKDKDTANILIQIMSLENYVKLIEKLEIQNYHILKEKKLIYDFVESFEWFSKIIAKMQKKGLTIFKKNVQAMKDLGG